MGKVTKIILHNLIFVGIIYSSIPIMKNNRWQQRFYRQPVTHRQRAAVVFLIDCSLSMLQPGKVRSLTLAKHQIAALMCNLMIDEFVMRASRNGIINNYYDIAAIGYTGNGIVSLLPGDSNGFTSIEKLAELTPSIKTISLTHQANGEAPIEVPMTLHEWIDPQPFGNASMVEGLSETYMLIDKWCHMPDNRDNFPPLVFHFTDGAHNQRDRDNIIYITSRIKSVNTSDGDALLFNILLTSYDDNYSVMFPTNHGFNRHSAEERLMFETSSMVPKSLENFVAFMLDIKRSGPYRSYIVNSSACELISILNIGTESVNNVKYL